jgi:hypothetical protein
MSARNAKFTRCAGRESNPHGFKLGLQPNNRQLPRLLCLPVPPTALCKPRGPVRGMSEVTRRQSSASDIPCLLTAAGRGRSSYHHRFSSVTVCLPGKNVGFGQIQSFVKVLSWLPYTTICRLFVRVHSDFRKPKLLQHFIEVGHFRTNPLWGVHTVVR